MIKDGVLKNPNVDAIIALHNKPIGGESGDVMVTLEPTSANIFAYKAVFTGKGAHVCTCRHSTNPVYMASEAALKIEEFLFSDSDENLVNAVTVINGGIRNNIIPQDCSIEGSIRSFDKKKHDLVREKTLKIMRDVAAARGGKVDITVSVDLMCTQIDPFLYEQFKKTTAALFPDNGCKPLVSKEVIGEDFARYTEIIPGLYFFLCAPPKNQRYPLHNPKFDLDEKQLSKGSALFAAFALGWQEN